GNGSISVPDGGQLNPPYEVTYTPNANYSGSDTFEFELVDPEGALDIGEFTIQVTQINDFPDATATTHGTSEDTPVNISLQATDVEGDDLTFSIVSQPGGGAHGTVVINDASTGDVTYTPALD